MEDLNAAKLYEKHGYYNSSESDYSGKSDFDEDYYTAQPPPLPRENIQNKIVKISPVYWQKKENELNQNSVEKKQGNPNSAAQKTYNMNSASVNILKPVQIPCQQPLRSSLVAKQFQNHQNLLFSSNFKRQTKKNEDFSSIKTLTVPPCHSLSRPPPSYPPPTYLPPRNHPPPSHIFPHRLPPTAIHSNHHVNNFIEPIPLNQQDVNISQSTNSSNIANRIQEEEAADISLCNRFRSLFCCEPK